MTDRIFTTVFVTAFFILYATSIIAQSGSVRLGSQITNGVTSGGCSTPCVTNVPITDPSFICNPSGTGNSSATVIHNLSVPSHNYLQLTVVTNECDVSTDGLDNGDEFKVNGVTVVSGNSNTRVNYSGCFYNGGQTDVDVPLTLIVNRRDETVTASWTITPTNPGGNCNNATPLPVAFKYFDVQSINNVSKITFVTASETNNDYFSIERSVDGRIFERLDDIKGAGSTTDEHQYTFIDDDPLPGINYYRVRQTDFDGRYNFSQVKVVRHHIKDNIVVSPSSTDGDISIATDIDDYRVAVYNSAGEQVAAFANLSGHQWINIQTLRPGLYFIQVNNGVVTKTFRVIKI